MKYMMATKAIHMTGDISRDEEDLCHVHAESKENYIGSWVTGIGFMEVKFPKETTRDLTAEEVKKYNLMHIGINNSYSYQIEINESDKVED